MPLRKPSPYSSSSDKSNNFLSLSRTKSPKSPLSDKKRPQTASGRFSSVFKRKDAAHDEMPTAYGNGLGSSANAGNKPPRPPRSAGAPIYKNNEMDGPKQEWNAHPGFAKAAARRATKRSTPSPVPVQSGHIREGAEDSEAGTQLQPQVSPQPQRRAPSIQDAEKIETRKRNSGQSSLSVARSLSNRESFVDGDIVYSNGATIQRTLSDGRIVNDRSSSLKAPSPRAPSVTPSRKSSKSSLRRTLTPNGREVCEMAEMRFSEDTRRPMVEDTVESTLSGVEEERGRPMRKKFALSSDPMDIGGSIDFMNQVSFSNRGSVLLGGKRALEKKKDRESILIRDASKSTSREPSISEHGADGVSEKSLAINDERSETLHHKRSFRDEDGGQLMRTITERSVPESPTASFNIQESASARQSMQLLASQVAEDFRERSASGESHDQTLIAPIDPALIEEIGRKAGSSPSAVHSKKDTTPAPESESALESTDCGDNLQPQTSGLPQPSEAPPFEFKNLDRSHQQPEIKETIKLVTEDSEDAMGASYSKPVDTGFEVEMDEVQKSKPTLRPSTAPAERAATPEILDSQQLSELANAPASPEQSAVEDARQLNSPDPVLKRQLQARPDIAQRYPKSLTESVKKASDNSKLEMRILSKEIEEESQRIRALYEADTVDETDWRKGEMEPSAFSAADSSRRASTLDPLSAAESDDAFPENSQLRPRPHTAVPSIKRESVLRREGELAGGIEDWTDVAAQSVDRYGFIVDPPTSGPESPSASTADAESRSAAGRGTQRSKSVFRKPSRSISGREPGSMRNVSSSRSLRTMATSKSAGAEKDGDNFTIRTAHTPGKTRRAILNRLPGMTERRLVSEAGSMLLPSPFGSAPQKSATAINTEDAAKKAREGRRAEKWLQMAEKIPRHDAENTEMLGAGGGMQFHFNARDPKLISRVWKGIPDVWRGAAWSSFLLTSSMYYKNSASTEDLITAFRELVNVSSADDAQIDMDMPRTVNNHIMFRTRYRGGQRLLFRVLHVLSLYFPETGYVQGMAAIVSTLLNYYDEEMCFVNAARMWEYRGLKRLFAPEFPGLMSALSDFEHQWLKRGSRDIAEHLEHLGVFPTTYGTRWYLTLFNYSVPFEVQLRIWDLFILLGDPNLSGHGSQNNIPRNITHSSVATTNTDAAAAKMSAMGSSSAAKKPEKDDPEPWYGQLDILHAAGCTLIDAGREMIMGPKMSGAAEEGEGEASDFENAMKVLTSFVPVRDEELFVKVLGVEWRRGGRK